MFPERSTWQGRGGDSSGWLAAFCCQNVFFSLKLLVQHLKRGDQGPPNIKSGELCHDDSGFTQLSH